ncbi:MAG: repeat protein [Frankiales bacterium]|nr:repeat protein [Frankiales bacterium]
MRVAIKLSGVVLSTVLAGGALVGVAGSSYATPDPTPITSATTVGAAVSAAEDQGSRVQIDSLLTATSTTWANPDGTFTRDTSPTPVRVSRGDGWAPVDTTLVEHPDGSITTASTTADITIGGESSDDLATIQLGGGSVTYGWPTALPEPELSGSTATYPDVLPDTDLRVTASDIGVETSLIVKAAPADPSPTYDFPVTVTGLTASTDEGGNTEYSDDSGVVGLAGAPMVWDSTINAATQTPDILEASYSETTPSAGKGSGAGTSSVTDTDQTIQHVSIDEGALAVSTVTYPIIVDPATTRADVAFAYVDQNNPAQSYVNDGWDSSQLHVGAEPGTNKVNRALWIFNNAAGFDGSTIISGTLETTETHAYSCTAKPVGAWRTGSWGGGMTWTSQPTPVGPASTVSTAKGYTGCASGQVNFDVTALLQAQADAGQGNFYMELRAGTETDPTQWKKFDASATLAITYDHVPSTPDGRSISPCAICPSPALTNSNDPAMTAHSTDADGGSLNYDFELWNGNSASPTVRRATGTVHAAQGVPIAWHAGPLPDGTYEYRVQATDGAIATGWSPGWVVFTVDTTPPAPPTIAASAAWPQYLWVPANSGTFNWSDSDPSVTGYATQLDAQAVSAYSTATTISYTGVTTNMAHSFGVRAHDAAGNVSATTGYTFGVGALPNVPTNTIYSYTGQTCFNGVTDTFRGNISQDLHATISDPNNLNVTATFQVVDSTTGATVLTYTTPTASPSGSVASATLPANAISNGHSMYWHVYATNSRGESSGWNLACGAIVDNTALANPTIQSSSFGTATPSGRIGDAGTFTLSISPATPYVTRYVWSDSKQTPPTSTDLASPDGLYNGYHFVTVPHGTSSLSQIYIPQQGNFVIAAWTIDGAKQPSTTSTQAFQVGQTDVTTPLHGWLTNAAPSTLTDFNTTSAITMAVSGPATVQTDGASPNGDNGVLNVDNSSAGTPATVTGSATAEPVGATHTFTVLAWLKPTSRTTGVWQTAVSQDQGTGSGFVLGEDPSGNWAFCVAGTAAGHCATAPATQTGFVQLVGVWEPGTGQVKLYVGSSASSPAAIISISSPTFGTDGVVRLGSQKISGAVGGLLNGELTDPVVYDGELTGGQLLALSTSPPFSAGF